MPHLLIQRCLSFNELEEELLRFLKEEFLEKGHRPPTRWDPVTEHRDVMNRFGLDLPRYREVMARLEAYGIVRVIAINARYGRLQIDPVVVDIVRQLDERAEQAKAAEKQTNPIEPANPQNKGRRARGRPRGSRSSARDLNLYRDWENLHRERGTTKAEFLQMRGLPEEDLAAIERGRAQVKRRSGQK